MWSGRLPAAVASLCWGAWLWARGFSNCSCLFCPVAVVLWAPCSCGLWSLPRPGLTPRLHWQADACLLYHQGSPSFLFLLYNPDTETFEIIKDKKISSLFSGLPFHSLNGVFNEQKLFSVNPLYQSFALC